MTESKTVKKQVKYLHKDIEDGQRIEVEVRHDDECGNRYNIFAITGTIYNKRGKWECGGCIHEEIVKYFPELEKYIKWHLFNANGPSHYLANTLYHAKEAELELARATAIAPEATLEQLRDKKWLEDRLPALIEEFKKDIEELGFVY